MQKPPKMSPVQKQVYDSYHENEWEEAPVTYTFQLAFEGIKDYFEVKGDKVRRLTTKELIELAHEG
jgi:hypothetical protein